MSLSSVSCLISRPAVPTRSSCNSCRCVGGVTVPHPVQLLDVEHDCARAFPCNLRSVVPLLEVTSG